MDILQDSNDSLYVIQERIIKTDEVLKLLDVKRKERNKLEKKYKKLLEKYSEKNKEVLNLNLLWEKKIEELQAKNELLVKNHHNYINDAESKYQSACQEIVTLNKTCDEFKKKIEKTEQKEYKAKNIKKIQDLLHETKEKLKDSLSRYNKLESTSNKTIFDLKKECKNLEETHNKTLKQLAKNRLEFDDAKKSSLEQKNKSSTKLKLENRIEELETTLEATEIEHDILKQSHEDDITHLKKQHEKEKKLLEDELEKLKIKKNEELNKNNKKTAQQYDITELTVKHEDEKKSLLEKIEGIKRINFEETKQHENEISILKNQIDELKSKISKKANKVKETVGTQTDYEDIYNLEDILYEMHSLPVLMSPLNHESRKEDMVEDNVINSLTCSTAVGTDDIIPTFTDSCTQTCNSLTVLENKLKLKSFSSHTEVFDKIGVLEEKLICSVGNQTDNFKSLSDSSTQTTDFTNNDPLSVNQNKIKVKSFNQLTNVFEGKARSTCSVATDTDNFISITDSSSQTYETEIEFKSFVPSVMTLPKSNILQEIPKNIKLKSKVVKIYKNNNRNKLWNTLKNSKLNLISLLEKFLHSNSKLVIVSSNILKSEFSKAKISENPENSEQKMADCSNSSCHSGQHIKQLNCCSCSCSQNMSYTNYCKQHPTYHIPCNCNHNMNYPSNNFNNCCTIKRDFKSKYFDDNSSDSEEEDKNLRQLLREYKHMAVQKYITNKYLAKITKKTKKLNSNEFENILFKKPFNNNVEKNKTKSSDKKEKTKNKSLKQYRTICSSDSEEEADKISSTSQNKTTNIFENPTKKSKKTPKIKTPIENLPIEIVHNNEETIKSSANNRISLTTKNNCKEIQESPEKVQVPENKLEVSKTIKNIETKVIETGRNLPKSLCTLSKKQQILLKKVKSLKKGYKPINTSINKELKPATNKSKKTLKRKSSCSSNTEYKIQKLELFGSDSDSSTSNSEVDEQSKQLVISVDNKTNKNETFISSEKNKPDLQKFKILANQMNEQTDNLNVNYLENQQNSVLLDGKERISLPNNETVSLPENKVYKKPERSKLKTTKIQSETQCKILVPKLNIDLPKYSLDENTKINDLVDTHSKCDTKLNNVSQEISTLKQIDLDLAQKFISDVANLNWDKDLMSTVVSYLSNKDSATVARLIVNIAAKDFSQVFDKSFTPPAPLLTTTQQKLLVLLNQLEKHNLPNIHSNFLQAVERRLLSESRVEVVHPLTRLFVAACKIKYEIEKVRTLCCDAAYYMGDLLLPLMFIVLTMWGDILPMAKFSSDTCLVIALVQVIHLKDCTEPGYNHKSLNMLLKDYYGYERGDHSNEEIMDKLITSYSETFSKTSYTAILILCRSLPNNWTYNQIKTHMLPIIEKSNCSEKKSMTVALVQRLLEKFEGNIDEDKISDIKKCLSKALE